MAKYSDRSDPGEQAVMNWVVAALSIAGAVGSGWALGWSFILDLNNPDFNPVVLVQLLLICVAGWHILKALRWRARNRMFGAADIEIDGYTPVPMGGTLSGVLRLGRPVAATGDWALRLTCFDIHETHETSDASNAIYRNDAYPVWNSQVFLPADTDTSEGLAFRFQLPRSVGPKPVNPMKRKNSYFSFTASVNIPGFKRVVHHNAPPVARYWTLHVSAPTAGPEFLAEFPVPVSD